MTVNFEISKTFDFSASHQLHGLREGHPCGRLHGHNYRVRVALTAPGLDAHGFVLDYGDLTPFGAWINATLDHRHLNDVLAPTQPSAEQLAWYLHGILLATVPLPPGVSAVVGVSETPKTWATYRGLA